MEPGSSTNVNVPLDRVRDNLSSSLVETAYAGEATGANMTATAVSLPSANNQLVLYTERPQFSSSTSVASSTSQPSNTASTSSSSSSSAPIEKLSRPMAFEKVCIQNSLFYSNISRGTMITFDSSLSLLL